MGIGSTGGNAVAGGDAGASADSAAAAASGCVAGVSSASGTAVFLLHSGWTALMAHDLQPMTISTAGPIMNNELRV